MQDLVPSPRIEDRDVLEAREADLLGARVREVDTCELHVESASGQGLRRLRLLDQGHEVENLKHALEADDCAHDVQASIGQHRQRGVETGEQQSQSDDLAGVEVAEHRLGTADAVDQREGQGRHQCQ